MRKNHCHMLHAAYMEPLTRIMNFTPDAVVNQTLATPI